MIDHADVGAFVGAAGAHCVGEELAADTHFVVAGAGSLDERANFLV